MNLEDLDHSNLFICNFSQDHFQGLRESINKIGHEKTYQLLLTLEYKEAVAKAMIKQCTKRFWG